MCGQSKKKIPVQACH
jgi:hypothetical protein